MKPILYRPDDTATTYNGIGALYDAISCIVTNGINGPYTLELEYPITGVYSNYIDANAKIKALANDQDEPQLFRIRNVRDTLKGTKIVSANHISYDLSGRPVKPYTAAGAAAALAAIETNSVIPTGFVFTTDMSSNSPFALDVPKSARAILGGSDGSLIDTYGGELYFDNFNVAWLERIGADNGVKVRYSKNLTDLTRDINTDETHNGIFPYWYKESDGVVYPSGAVTGSWAYGYDSYIPVDFTDVFENKPSAAQLTTAATAAINGYLSPSETLDVSFVSLHQAAEYEAIAALERVGLGDTVHCICQIVGDDGKIKLDIDRALRCSQYVYNTLSENYESLILGKLQTTLTDYILRV